MMARLDRFLVIDDRDNYFGGVAQTLVPKPTRWREVEFLAMGPLPFELEKMWLKAKGFKSLVDDWWRSLQVVGTGSYVLTEKLKFLKFYLRRWRQNHLWKSGWK